MAVSGTQTETKELLASKNYVSEVEDAIEHFIAPGIPGWSPDLVWTEEEEKKVPSLSETDASSSGFIPNLRTAACSKWDCFMFVRALNSDAAVLPTHSKNLDRQNISNALTNNLAGSIGATTETINLGSTMLLIGFCIFEIPSNMIWLSILMVGWGLVSTFQMFIYNPTTFLTTRFLIGAFEAGWVPGVVLYLSLHYKRDELATRLSYFYACNNLSAVLGSLLAFGILRMDGVQGLKGWQWLFGLEGAATVVAGVLSFWLLSDVPQANKRLTDRERQIAVTRIFRDDPSKAVKGRHFVPLQEVWAALSDWNVWPNLIFAFLDTFVAAGFALYAPLIIVSFGYDALLSNVLTIPGNALHLVNQIVSGYVADRYRMKWQSTIASSKVIAFGISGLILGYSLNLAIPASKSQAGAYFSFVLTVGFFLPWHAVNASWQAANVAPNGKRAIVFSMYVISVTISGTMGLWIYKDDDKPGFRRALGTSIGILCAALLIVILRRIQLGYLNRMREAKWSQLDEKQKDKYLREDAPKLGDKALSFRYIW
ncbi:hypothetical protein HDU93_004164 [Gonapodya sp. JEL0774]|nr:hypothetical protein HDU93_004164 [Gonapodya sp. JEL0774]